MELKENLMEFSSEINYKKVQLSEDWEKKKQEREELLAKYKELLEHKNLVTRRLLKAFPNMISRNQNEMLQKYKEYLTSRKNN